MKKAASFKPKPCSECGSSYHTALLCPHKPRTQLKRASRPMRREAVKTRSKRLSVRQEWFRLNPADEDGMWQCYLMIHPDCPGKLVLSELVLEHYESKVRRPDLKFDVTNIKAACSRCNGMKLSKSGSEFVENDIW